MSPAPQRAGLATATLGMALVLGLMWGLKEELNPDWWGYAAIYQDAGAWLADQGRDPLFLLLVASLSSLLGPDSYDAFRLVIGLYFAAFTYGLLRGRVLHFGAAVHRWPLLLLGLLPLVALRFTVQIREGLALTLVLFGMALLSQPQAVRTATAAPPASTRAGKGTAASGAAGSQPGTLAALLLFCAGAALHSGVAILLLAWLLGGLISRLCAQSTRLELWLLLTLGLGAVSLSAGLATFGLATRTGSDIVSSVYGSLADDDATLSWLKWLYWAAYGWGVAVMASQVRRLYGSGKLPPRLRPMLGLMALVLLPAIYVTALLLLAGGMPAIVVSGASRVMNMLLSVTLLVLALRGALGWRLGLFALLVLVDQARIMVEAVVSTTGLAL